MPVARQELSLALVEDNKYLRKLGWLSEFKIGGFELTNSYSSYRHQEGFSETGEPTASAYSVIAEE
jgi:hypothetical protein